MLGKFRIFIEQFVLFFILVVACSAVMSAEDIANSLSERLEFDDSRVIEGEPPEENSGDNDYPQITIREAPDAILENKQFEIVLETDFEEADEVDGAVVYVKSATRYIEVDAELDTRTRSMTLTGELDSTEGVPGDEYDIEIAMIKGREVGNYERWRVTTPRSEEDCQSACSTLDSAGCLEEFDIDYDECMDGCEEAQPSLDCYNCINERDDCDDIWNCISRECGVTGYEDSQSYIDGDDYFPRDTDGDERPF